MKSKPPVPASPVSRRNALTATIRKLAAATRPIVSVLRPGLRAVLSADKFQQRERLLDVELLCQVAKPVPNFAQAAARAPRRRCRRKCRPVLRRAGRSRRRTSATTRTASAMRIIGHEGSRQRLSAAEWYRSKLTLAAWSNRRAAELPAVAPAGESTSESSATKRRCR